MTPSIVSPMRALPAGGRPANALQLREAVHRLAPEQVPTMGVLFCHDVGRQLADWHAQTPPRCHLALSPAAVRVDAHGRFSLAPPRWAIGEPIPAGAPGYAPIDQRLGMADREPPEALDLFAFAACALSMWVGHALWPSPAFADSPPSDEHAIGGLIVFDAEASERELTSYLEASVHRDEASSAYRQHAARHKHGPWPLLPPYDRLAEQSGALFAPLLTLLQESFAFGDAPAQVRAKSAEAHRALGEEALGRWADTVRTCLSGTDDDLHAPLGRVG